MDYATSRGQDEVSVLARLRARQPFDVLDYKLPRAPAGQVVGFAAMTKKQHKGKAAKQQINPQKCMWKKLPIELRYKIYEEACFTGPHVTVHSSAEQQWEGPFRFPRQLEARAFARLQRVCRSIHADLRSHPVFYKRKHFGFDEPQVLHNFPRRVLVQRRPRRNHNPARFPVGSSFSAFQALVGAPDIPATAPDPAGILAGLPQVLPCLRQLRIITPWLTSSSIGVVPPAKDTIRELIEIPNLRDMVPGKHHTNNPSMIPKRDDFSFGFVMSVKFHQADSLFGAIQEGLEQETQGNKGPHRYCLHCFIAEFRNQHPTIKKYGGRLRSILKDVEWCVGTNDIQPFKPITTQGGGV
ncbi:uncharacterized protein PG998_003127 [Apiospora kogelbergensis]|uniref:uncharacterized protein n=1 Tax=Apiospora kogelbergensis TaxID=1337665 RepID=UPI00312DDCA8